jgi:hypothetical protein
MLWRHLVEGHKKTPREAEALLPDNYRRRTKSEREAEEAAEEAADAAETGDDSEAEDNPQMPDDVETSGDEEEGGDDAPAQAAAAPPRRLVGHYEPVFPQNRPGYVAQAPPDVQQPPQPAAQPEIQ